MEVSTMTTTTTTTTTQARGSAFGLLTQARSVLTEAAEANEPGERFRLAHLSALRTAAAVSAQRGRPASARRRLTNVWVLLERVAPEHAGWAAYFAAGAPIRAAIEAGAMSAVSTRTADDQLRSAAEFLALVEDSLGLLAA
jgi:predicted ATP-grasp superfamily ATP-dependent carboligase